MFDLLTLNWLWKSLCDMCVWGWKKTSMQKIKNRIRQHNAKKQKKMVYEEREVTFREENANISRPVCCVCLQLLVNFGFCCYYTRIKTLPISYESSIVHLLFQRAPTSIEKMGKVFCTIQKHTLHRFRGAGLKPFLAADVKLYPRNVSVPSKYELISRELT